MVFYLELGNGSKGSEIYLSADQTVLGGPLLSSFVQH